MRCTCCKGSIYLKGFLAKIKIYVEKINSCLSCLQRWWNSNLWHIPKGLFLWILWRAKKREKAPTFIIIVCVHKTTMRIVLLHMSYLDLEHNNLLNGTNKWKQFGKESISPKWVHNRITVVLTFSFQFRLVHLAFFLSSFLQSKSTFQKREASSKMNKTEKQSACGRSPYTQFETHKTNWGT